MKSSITQRIEKLRTFIQENQIQAFIIPSTDPHLSEYVAPHWKSREFITGFNGSAGTAVVTLKEAGLWTDSRYFLQATEQLDGTGITLYKEMLPETPDRVSFLATTLNAGDCIGIDGKLFSVHQVELLQKELEAHQLNLNILEDPMTTVWENRPSLPTEPAFLYDIAYAGKSCSDKVALIRSELKKNQTEALLLSSLDEIAWTLNIRGCDVHCNPVVISYLLIDQESVVWFVADSKINAEIEAALREQNVSIYSYEKVEAYLKGYKGRTISIDPHKTNYAIYSAIPPTCQIHFDSSPVTLLKSIRNETEIKGIYSAMKKDGIALVRFLKWLEERIPSEEESELSIDRKLHAFRAEQPFYIGESFDTIAGYKEHAAIVHYSATESTNATLKESGFLLLDSGAQYLDGTTDITRTIALGELTQEEKEDYTLVLKGHIALAMAKFPLGTRGAQLDVLARMPLWQKGLNYLHGTGHGVGHFLNVHEGPQSIRMNENPVVLQPGMVTSNEPGVYKAGSHGIRIENLILTCAAGEGMFGPYLQFETLTLCPICKKGILKERLTEEELHWLNNYHQTVYTQLSPSLTTEEKAWLSHATSAI
ncbi:MAG: aminopeptidase P family protein [Bacteroidia bacterium]|nr:aminopeptidase P family protein [Bacteroidia bacterium]